MGLKKTYSFIKKWWAIFLSAFFLFISISALIFGLYKCRIKPQTIIETRTDIITISGVLSALIIAYLTSKILQVRSERIERLPEINNLTQKLHRFRAIVNKLLASNLWPDDLPQKLDYKYKNLSFFDVREGIFVDGKISEQAKNFIEDESFGGISQLILELKSFIFKGIPFDKTLYSEYDTPLLYSSEILEKWIKYDCGNGLWYYFDHKYPAYKNSLHLENVYKGYQEEVKNYAISIDKEKYMKMEFSSELLSTLGNQFYSDIIPKLYRKQIDISSKPPSIIIYLFTILCLIISFGIVIPLLSKLFSFLLIIDIICISVILSTCFYILISFYSFLKKEIILIH